MFEAWVFYCSCSSKNVILTDVIKYIVYLRAADIWIGQIVMVSRACEFVKNNNVVHPEEYLDVFRTIEVGWDIVYIWLCSIL